MIQTRLDSFNFCPPCPTITKKPKYVPPKCPHGSQKSRCVKCGGVGICVHKKQRRQCKECGGSQICKHDRRRSMCGECGGSEICKHGSQKSRCVKCGGVGICVHKKQRRQCSICDPAQHTARLRRNRRYEVLKNKTDRTHTLDDLCVTIGEWIKYLHELFEVRYGRPKTDNDKVQIDEIIPCRRWNLPDDNKYCWHYLNSQWLIDNTNQEKGTKYTEEDKRAMIQRIDEWFTSNPYQPCSTSSPS
jgi:hypothetical protein